MTNSNQLQKEQGERRCVNIYTVTYVKVNDNAHYISVLAAATAAAAAVAAVFIITLEDFLRAYLQNFQIRSPCIFQEFSML